MSNDYYVREILYNIEIKKKKNKQRKTVIFSGIAVFFIVIVLLISNVFADNIVQKFEDDNGEYLYFTIDHNFTTAKYKYYGYGYNISLYDRSTKQFSDVGIGTERGKQVFMPNHMFDSYFEGNKEIVEIYIRKILEITGVEEEYFYSNNLTIYLNARIGIKVDNKLVHLYDSLEGDVLFGMPEGHKTGNYNTREDGSAPLNGDGLGIKNSIEHYYGVNWSGATQNNLKDNFNIKYDLKASALYDGLLVEYRYNGQRIGYKPMKPFEKAGIETVTPEIVSGYVYTGTYEQGIVYDKNMISGNGDEVKVKIEKRSDRYVPKYHHIVFKYDKLPDTGTPISVDAEYRLGAKDGQKIADDKKFTGHVNTQFNLSSEKLDDYICKKYIVIGQTEKEIEGTSASFKMNSESWCTPVNSKLKVIFIYEERPVVIIPKCEPRFDGLIGSTNITMKRSVFDNLDKISVQNASFGIENLTVGQDKDRNPVEGQHKFDTFDFYVYVNGKGNSPFEAKWDNIGHNANLSFDVPKTMFTKLNDTTYRANIDVDYVTFCSCKGAGFCLWTWHEIIINIIENKPPVALYSPVTKVEQANGSIRIIDEVYINRQATILNHASDPNGDEDIDYIKYSFVNSKMERYYLKMTKDKGNGIFYTDENTLEEAGIEFLGITEVGDLKLIFKTGESWTVNQLVKDVDGLQDIYTDVIIPIEPDLNPIAILDDISSYRYPASTSFSGKQNRIVGLSSTASKVANLLQDTGVEIDHNKDCIEIIPLNNQSISNIFFESELEKDIVGNILVINNVDFRSQKLMFKEVGQYKIRLQVTDTEGNVSKWTEKTLTIVEDKTPTVTATYNAKNYRNERGTATVILKNIIPKSIDDDYAAIEKIEYKYDSNNDGIFANETLINLTSSNGQVSFTSSELGKYQFVITVRENFGQPTLDKYITENDYKRAERTFITEIDNIAPDVTEFQIKRKDRD